jgi:hypothetical protein
MKNMSFNASHAPSRDADGDSRNRSGGGTPKQIQWRVRRTRAAHKPLVAVVLPAACTHSQAGGHRQLAAEVQRYSPSVLEPILNFV